MADSVRLRTLTWKSSYGFGNSFHKDLTMLQLYDLGKIPMMIKAYFTLEKISYIDEILDSIGITEELRINKPFSFRKGRYGDCNERIKKSMDNYYNRIREEEGEKGIIKQFSKQKAQFKRKSINNLIGGNKSLSPSYNRQYNQKNKKF